MTENKNNEMALTETKDKRSGAELVEIGQNGIMLRSLSDLLRFAALAVKGGAAPKAMTEGQAAIAIQAGLERGLGPLGGLQQCVVINGVLSWRGQGAVALVQNSKLCKPGSLQFGTEGEGASLKGFATAWRIGYDQLWRREFSIADANRAGLTKKSGPWQEYPGRMLMWRALGLLLRDLFPDVLGGFPIAEEAQDFEPRRVEATVEKSPEKPEKPSGPDPLMEALQLESTKHEPNGDVEAEEEPAAETEPEQEEAEPDPPFSSHEEADRELLKEEERNLFR